MNLDILFDRCKDFGCMPNEIGILKELFVGVQLRVSHQNQLSPAIHTTKGAMQGTAISPFLFAIYIDDLAKRVLSMNDVNVPVVNGIRIPICLFADDTEINTLDAGSHQRILDVCHAWGIENGIEWNASKSMSCFPKTKHWNEYQALLGETRIEKVEEFTYLGLQFNRKGLDTQAILKKRSGDTEKCLQGLIRMGMNVNGFSHRVSVNVYKSFIRSMMEYGLVVSKYKKKHLDVLEKLQKRSLRSIFSKSQHSKTSSYDGMLALTAIPYLEVRRRYLTAKMQNKFKSLND
jgi:hypothetical protein